jgi:hypothetical protein
LCFPNKNCYSLVQNVALKFRTIDIQRGIWNEVLPNWKICVRQWTACVAVLTWQTVMWSRLHCL